MLETLILNMPQENYEKRFDTFLTLARFGNLFAYDEVTERMSCVSRGRDRLFVSAHPWHK